MNNFVPDIREDRFNEIRDYEERGYIFNEKRKYEFVRNIDIPINGKTNKYQVRVDFSEVKFHISNCSGGIYFSVLEIYRLLNRMTLIEGKDYVVEVMRTYISSKNQMKFQYKDKNYMFRIPSINSVEGEFELKDADLVVTYKELFILVSLIQDKSNYLFSLSEGCEKYYDGLIRMLIALLSLKEDNHLLNELGWKYDQEYEQFNLEYKKTKMKNGRKSKKYYLTEDELKNILK